MSLIKQLWIAIGLIMSMVFTACFIASIESSRHTLEQQLQMKNIDNAASLALSISQMEKDPVAVGLLLSAQFDNGHYQRIRLTDPNGHVISERTNPEMKANTPDWFNNLFPIEVRPGIAQVQSGWSQFGTLMLESDTTFAYQDLWQSSRKMLMWSVLIALAAGLIGSLVLRYITRPLNEMVNMAEAIGEQRFITIQEPRVKEFKTLAHAMNRLSARIKKMLAEQSQLLEQLRFEANYEPISGLMNRKYFTSRVAAYIDNEESFEEGVLVISHISELAEMNDKLGGAATDLMLKRVGEALNKICKNNTSMFAGRLTGADFALFSGNPLDMDTICNQMREAIVHAAAVQEHFPAFSPRTIANRIGKSDQLDSLKDLVSVIKSRTDLDQLASEISHLTSEVRSPHAQAGDASEWRTMLTAAIRARRVKLASFPVVTADNRLLHHESPVRMQLAEHGEWLPAAEFIAWAIRLDLITEIDNLVVRIAIESLAQGQPAIGLNVSTRAICNPGYLAHLRTLLQAHPQAARNLWLEVPEDGVFRHMEEFRTFCRTLKPLGCRIGVEHVGANIARLGELHDLDLDYIKIDASVIRNINSNSGNQAFLKGLCLIVHSLGLTTIAEGVQTPEERAALPALGIDGMTGPAIKLGQ